MLRGKPASKSGSGAQETTWSGLEQANRTHAGRQPSHPASRAPSATQQTTTAHGNKLANQPAHERAEIRPEERDARGPDPGMLHRSSEQSRDKLLSTLVQGRGRQDEAVKHKPQHLPNKPKNTPNKTSTSRIPENRKTNRGKKHATGICRACQAHPAAAESQTGTQNVGVCFHNVQLGEPELTPC